MPKKDYHIFIAISFEQDDRQNNIYVSCVTCVYVKSGSLQGIQISSMCISGRSALSLKPLFLFFQHHHYHHHHHSCFSLPPIQLLYKTSQNFHFRFCSQTSQCSINTVCYHQYVWPVVGAHIVLPWCFISQIGQ